MAFVVTSGEIMSVRTVSTWHAYGAGPAIPSYVKLGHELTLTYAQLWRAQPALHTVVAFLARNVAQLGVDPYRKVSATDRVKLTDHPVARLLERPREGSKWTKYRLLHTIMSDLCVYDNAFILKMRGDDGVRALLPIPPEMIAPYGPQWASAEGYRIAGPGGHRDVDVNDVIHIHGYNPTDPRQGVSPIETLRQILSEEHAASTYREQLWRNGARIAGYIQRPEKAPRWSPEARDRFQNEWMSQYSGDGPSTGGTPILEDGMTFLGGSVTPQQAQYVESRKLTREEVAVAYHVSPVMIGLMDGATFSNVTELHKMLYQDTLAPYLAQIAQDLECQLLEDIDPSAKDGSTYIEFNLAEKLRGSFAEQASAFQSAVGAPWMTRDEARSMNNLPQVDGADELIVPLNVITGGLAAPNDTAPDNPANGSTPKAHTMRDWYDRQGRVVTSRIGAAKGDGIVDAFALDRARWDRELAGHLTKAGVLGADLAHVVAGHLNDETGRRLALASTEPDPVAAARRVFDALIRECETS